VESPPAARTSSVLDAAADGIVVVDDRARVLTFNRASEQLFGYCAADMIGRDLKLIIRSEFADGDGSHIGGDADFWNTPHAGRDVKGRHSDGTMFPIELTTGATTAVDGRRFVLVLRDLRPRRQIERRHVLLQGELMRMLRVLALEEIGAALSHEVNQPLTALLLYLQAVARAIEKQAPGSVFCDRTLGLIDKAVHEAERVGSVVQTVRQSTETRLPERRPVDLAPLIADAIELALIGSEPSTRVVRSFASDLPQVLVDPLQIQQVVVNLLRNALEANRAHLAAEVRVTTRREQNEIHVVIEDDGPGIAPDALRDLFKPFSSKMVEGLGLAISRTIAQNHGGALSVDPGGNGSGASYALHLPVPAATEE
jgi:two-component system, LuxR family, sensor kinase FixL